MVRALCFKFTFFFFHILIYRVQLQHFKALALFSAEFDVSIKRHDPQTSDMDYKIFNMMI